MKLLSALLLSFGLSSAVWADETDDIQNLLSHMAGMANMPCEMYLGATRTKATDDLFYMNSLSFLSGVNAGLALRSRQLKREGELDLDAPVQLMNPLPAIIQDQRLLLDDLYKRCKDTPEVQIGGLLYAISAIELYRQQNEN